MGILNSLRTVSVTPAGTQAAQAAKPANVNRGVFWRGQDNKVYVAGDKGTNAAGSYDGNSAGYWKALGYNEVGDPNAHAVQSATSFNPDVSGMGGGSYAAGSGAAADPDLDPNRINAKRGEIRSLMAAFEQAYNDVIGQTDRLAAEKRANFEQNYRTQQEGLDKNFGTTTQGIDDQYSARNAYHSSYRENAQQQAKEAYDSATGQLGQARDKDLASVGQFAEQQKAEFGGSRPNFNVDDYESVGDLLSIQQSVNEAINKIRTTGAGLGTDSQYISKLNSITPTQETGSAALKAQLDKLAQTGSNPDAKRAIAAVTIQNAGGDQSAWMDYFEKQQQLTGSDAATATAEPALTIA